MRVRFIVIASLLCVSCLLLFQAEARAETGIIINKGTNQLAFFKNSFLLDVFPVASGRLPHYTPEGKCQVIVKSVYPSWRDPEGGPLIPGGVPENPLGPRWLGLNALGTGGNNYGIHGTNNPYSIGTYASSGCVRMHNEDILWLYERTPAGAKVEIINIDDDLSTWKKYDRVTVNGIEPLFDPHIGPAQAGETTFLPLRPMADALGYQLKWDEPTKTILLSNIDHEALFKQDSRQVTVNGYVYEAKNDLSLLENTTYIPDYIFQQYLGVNCKYEEDSRSLTMEAPTDPTGGRLVKHNLKITVNGKNIDLPAPLAPLTDGENLLVPVRPLCEAIGAKVGWNNETRSVEIGGKKKLVSIPADGSPAMLNGSVIDTPTLIFTRNGASYVSLRFLKYILGFQSEVDEITRTLGITTPGNGIVARLFFIRSKLSSFFAPSPLLG